MIINNKQSPIVTYLSIFGVLLLHGGIIKLLFMHYKPITNTYSANKIEVTFLTSEQVLEADDKLQTTQSSSFEDGEDTDAVPEIQQQNNPTDQQTLKKNNAKTKQTKHQKKDLHTKAQKKTDKIKENKSVKKVKRNNEDKNKTKKKQQTNKDVADKKDSNKIQVKNNQDTDNKQIDTKVTQIDDDTPIETLSESELENLTIAGEIGRSVATDNQSDSEYEIVETIGDRQELAEEIAREQQQYKQQQVTQQFDQQANNNIKVEFSQQEAQWAKKYSNMLPVSILDNIIDDDVFEVVVKLQIDNRGRIVSATKVKSSGRADIDNFALHDIKNARFKPFTRNNIPVAGSIILPIKYELGH